MKKRIGFILIFVVVGLILIEIFVRVNTPVNHAGMDYTLYYNENNDNERKLLLETKYFTYYFKHYDEESFIKFADGATYNIFEAFKEGYIFLGDLIPKIEIEKVPNFKLDININTKQDFVRKIIQRDWNIYYYHINDVQFVFDNNTTENLLDLITANEFSVPSIVDILDYMVEKNKIEKTNIAEYDLYETDAYKIFIKDWYVYFGDKTLSVEKIEKYHKK